MRNGAHRYDHALAKKKGCLMYFVNSLVLGWSRYL